MQYYISGRLTARAWQLPVHGNLLHHAVERFLKAALVGAATPEEMKNKWGHHLPTIWTKFKARYKDPALNRFDATIAALHKFEAIRYPEKLVTEGMFGAITWAPRPATKAAGPGPHPPRYEVIINEVDDLMLEIFQRAQINPQYFGNQLMASEAREALTYQNPRAAEWLQA
jgi:hypothetical protein